MAERCKVDAALAGFAMSCGMQDLVLDSDGRAAFDIGGVQVILSYLGEPDELFFAHVEIASVAEDDAAMLCLLLEEAFPSWRRGLMTIGLDGANGRAFGYLPFELDQLDAMGLVAAVGRMFEASLAIRNKLARGAGMAAAAKSRHGAIIPPGGEDHDYV